METKYNIGDRVWSIESNYNRKPTFKPSLLTIEKIDEVEAYHSQQTHDRIEGRTPFYRMVEGHAYWRAEADIFLTESLALEACIRANEIIRIKRQIKRNFKSALKKGKGISDGIYDVSGIESFEVDADNRGAAIVWMQNHKPFWVANAYETDCVILLTGKPRKLNSKNWMGSGFNYGSTNIIKDCPKDILILAEND